MADGGSSIVLMSEAAFQELSEEQLRAVVHSAVRKNILHKSQDVDSTLTFLCAKDSAALRQCVFVLPLALLNMTLDMTLNVTAYELFSGLYRPKWDLVVDWLNSGAHVPTCFGFANAMQLVCHIAGQVGRAYHVPARAHTLCGLPVRARHMQPDSKTDDDGDKGAVGGSCAELVHDEGKRLQKLYMLLEGLVCRVPEWAYMLRVQHVRAWQPLAMCLHAMVRRMHAPEQHCAQLERMALLLLPVCGPQALGLWLDTATAQIRHQWMRPACLSLALPSCSEDGKEKARRPRRVLACDLRLTAEMLLRLSRWLSVVNTVDDDAALTPGLYTDVTLREHASRLAVLSAHTRHILLQRAMDYHDPWYEWDEGVEYNGSTSEDARLWFLHAMCKGSPCVQSSNTTNCLLACMDIVQCETNTVFRLQNVAHLAARRLGFGDIKWPVSGVPTDAAHVAAINAEHAPTDAAKLEQLAQEAAIQWQSVHGTIAASIAAATSMDTVYVPPMPCLLCGCETRLCAATNLPRQRIFTPVEEEDDSGDGSGDEGVQTVARSV